MKKYTLIICSFLLLFGCSGKTENTTEYKGEHGTYEILDTYLTENPGLREEFAQLRLKIKYTNTTSEPRKPNDSIKLDTIIEHETDVELNEIEFYLTNYIGGELTEEQELIKNGSLNVKPDATLEVIIESVLENEKLDSIFLRNKNAQGQNGDKFEKQIKVK
ncbi:hypothetical protein [Paucisalibacillus globulus]|uniref:hypothetical protein n=1 Tax=Paucisalibacillus globulus TaxID=351095 RepID=UPI000BB8F9EC|nr:hypothetical protein [Paucisalibacillus globulus]